MFVNDDYYFWSLGGLLEDLCERSGLKPSDYYIYGLNRTVKGLILGGDEAASGALQTLALSHFFDVASYGGKIRFVERGRGAVAYLKYDDLVEKGDSITKKERGEPIEIPMLLSLEYFDLEGGVNSDLQSSSKAKDTRTLGEEKYETTEIMTADEAKTAVVKQHKLLIEEQKGEIEFTLSKEFVFLTVGDIIFLEDKRLRIDRIELDLHTQTYTCKYDRETIYKTQVKGIPVDKPTPPESGIINRPILEILDCNILKDEHDDLGLYVVVQRNSFNWEGVVLQTSSDGGENWETLDSVYSEGITAKTITELEKHSPYYQDKINSFEIKLTDDRDEIEEYSHRQILNRNGYIMIGEEIVAYEEAEFLGEGKYKISKLLRGRKGSETAKHEIGERVIFLTVGAVVFYKMSVATLGRTAKIRAMAIGTTNTYTEKQITFKGESQKELAPARLKASISDGKTHISWNGVGKLGGGGVVKHGAYFLGYNVFINNEDPIFIPPTQNNLTVDRVVSGKISVCGVNGYTGNGYESEVTI